MMWHKALMALQAGDCLLTLSPTACPHLLSLNTSWWPQVTQPPVKPGAYEAEGFQLSLMAK